MKKFNELSNSQKADALDHAYTELKELMEMGMISFDKVPDDEDLKEFALLAAMDTSYAETGDMIVSGIVE